MKSICIRILAVGAIALSLTAGAQAENLPPYEELPDWYGTKVLCLDKSAFDRKVKSGELKIIGYGVDELPDQPLPAQPGPIESLELTTNCHKELLVLDGSGLVEIFDAHVDVERRTKKIYHQYLCVRNEATISNFVFHHGEPYTLLPNLLHKK